MVERRDVGNAGQHYFGNNGSAASDNITDNSREMSRSVVDIAAAHEVYITAYIMAAAAGRSQCIMPYTKRVELRKKSVFEAIEGIAVTDRDVDRQRLGYDIASVTP